MKIVLLVLGGDSNHTQTILQKKYPTASVEVISREDLERRSSLQRIGFLRKLRPNVFAIATERLVWQRGQNAFLLLGALAGAQRTIIVDRHGACREETRARALLTAPPRLAREAAISATALVRAEKELRQLETAIQRAEPGQIDSRKKHQSGDHPNIVYLRSSPGPATQAGGAASHINGFVNAALKLGANVSLISNDEIAGLSHEVPLKIIWPKPVGSTRAAFEIYNNLIFTHAAIAEIERQKPDFIYQRYGRFSWAGVAAALRLGRPLFLEYNGSEVWVGRHWDHVGSLGLLARYERLNLQAAVQVFVVSEVERQNLLRAGVDDQKIVVNPNGVDVEHFKPGIGGERLRQELGIEAGEMLVGFVGTFGPWHGVETLATAITLMPPASPIRFLLVGSGALRDKVERILREGNADHRAIMAGTVAHERVPELLDACDVLVSPHVPLADSSDFFGSPTKLFEYMAMGKAIVASRLGQIGEVLHDNRTALLIEPGSAPQLGDAILRLAQSRELRERLGAAARREAIERHTWNRNAGCVLNAYKNLREA